MATTRTSAASAVSTTMSPEPASTWSAAVAASAVTAPSVGRTSAASRATSTQGIQAAPM